MNNRIDNETSPHNDLLRRLLAKDVTLWSTDAETSAGIQQRLGWLDAIPFSLTQMQKLEQFRDWVRSEGFDQAILLGMGGSSLAPEVFAQVFSPRGGANLTVLDTTFPDAIGRVTAATAGGKPLFIVSSKSGTTAETMALRRHFWRWAQTRFGDTAGNHFIAITDKQSSLHHLAQQHGYSEIFLNPADIGGRYSALSLFGLVPASVLGIDIEHLLNVASSVYSDGPQGRKALQLGVFIGEAAVAGRNKLTLTFSPSLSPLGAWIEQLVAESTGKQGEGIVPVIAETAAPPDHYGGDRCFVHIGMKAEERDPDQLYTRHLELERLGHPVLCERLDNIYELGAEFAKWQLATATACAIVGVNPFDEPDVNATKAATRKLLQNPIGSRPDGEDADTLEAQIPTLQQFLGEVRTNDYIAILAYLPADGQLSEALQKLRDRTGGLSQCATCLSFGPRYLHSSGQLHKGGPKNGHFLILTATAAEDIGIPQQRYGFQHLISAQARGDIAVLQQRGQKVLHIHLGPVATAASIILGLADRL